jgi:hypothetical protein
MGSFDINRTRSKKSPSTVPWKNIFIQDKKGFMTILVEIKNWFGARQKALRYCKSRVNIWQTRPQSPFIHTAVISNSTMMSKWRQLDQHCIGFIQYEKASTIKACGAMHSSCGVRRYGAPRPGRAKGVVDQSHGEEVPGALQILSRQNWHPALEDYDANMLSCNNWMGRNNLSWHDDMERTTYFKSCIGKSSSVKCKALWNSARIPVLNYNCGSKSYRY